ncbi:MAG: hypothetical protein U0703_16070 [Anaerolineae bacterium]
MPIYWTGTLAIYIFAVRLDWLSGTGFVLPTAVLGFHAAGAVGRSSGRRSTRDLPLALDFIAADGARQGLRERSAGRSCATCCRRRCCPASP